MPRPASEKEDRFDEVSMPEETLRRDTPVLRARVVYLGADKNKSVTFPGQLSVELVEDEAGTAVRDNGHRLARQMFEKEYMDLAPDEKAQVDAKKVERRYRELKQAIDAGMTSYDFRRFDATGSLIRERLMPDSAPTHLQGRPFQWVEHAGHIAKFFDLRGANNEKEFEVTAKPAHMEALTDYIRRTRRGRAQQSSELKEVLTGAKY